MKKITTFGIAILFPFTTWGQVDLSILSTIDVNEIAQCDKTTQECQTKISNLQQLLSALIMQVIAGADTQSIGVSNANYWQEKNYLDALSENPLSENRHKPFNVRDSKVVAFDDQTHPIYREIWRMFDEVVPEQYLVLFSEFTIYNDSDDIYAALVSQRVGNKVRCTSQRDCRATDIKEVWQLDVNLAYADMGTIPGYNRMMETIAHEAAHVLTNNDDQVTFDVDEKDCERFYLKDLESCSARVSYLTDFAQFWSSDYIEWANGLDRKSKKEKNAEIDVYYEENKQDFVSSYAATSPLEDIAETIAHFAMYKKPQVSNSVADKKILFFYAYPEMVSFREKVQTLLR